MAWTDLGERIINGIVEESAEKAIYVVIKTEDETRAYIIPEKKLDHQKHQQIVNYHLDGIFTQSLYDYITTNFEQHRLKKDKERVVGPYIIDGEYHFEA